MSLSCGLYTVAKRDQGRSDGGYMGIIPQNQSK